MEWLSKMMSKNNTAVLLTLGWLSLFLALPLFFMFYYSLTNEGNLPLTFSHFSSIFSSSPNLVFLLRTLKIALITTLLTMLISYPLSFYIAFLAKREKLILLIITLPLWISFIVRIYAWKLILSHDGIINAALLQSSLASSPLGFLYNQKSVVFGLIYGYLPFMIIPLYASLRRIPAQLFEAASDLGARGWDTFRDIIWPLSLKGLYTGIILVFIPIFGDYLTPIILGGPNSYLFGNLLGSQFTLLNNWSQGSAMIFFLLIFSIGLLVLFMKLFNLRMREWIEVK
jgi:spermidine/putrescine transport system permease protein